MFRLTDHTPAASGPARKGGKVPTAMERRRLHERLRLLCATGAGLEAVAAPVSAIARDLIGAMSGSIFWLGNQGEAAGFYHDSAPVEMKDFFVSNFDALFSSPAEANMVGLIMAKGPPIGSYVDQADLQRLHASNVGKYLAGPLGHHFLLDVRIDLDGQGRALLCLWNGQDRPFSPRDLAAMEPVRSQLCLAARPRAGNLHWRSADSRTRHLITDLTGERLFSIDPECEKVLLAGHLLGQSIPMAREMREAPGFCRQLAAMLARGEEARLHVPVANGRLELTATTGQLRRPGDTGSYLFIAVDSQISLEVHAVEWLSSLPLTFLQKQIALHAMQGGKRADCEDRFGVSTEALKKHLRMVYDRTGTSSWLELREMFLGA